MEHKGRPLQGLLIWCVWPLLRTFRSYWGYPDVASNGDLLFLMRNEWGYDHLFMNDLIAAPNSNGPVGAKCM